MSAPAVFFPDAVAATIAYLRASFDTVDDPSAPTRIVNKVPNPRPAKFLQVFRTGGPRHNVVVDGAQLTLAAWADAIEDAQVLAQHARAFLGAARSEIVGDVVIYRFDELAGPGDLPDPASNQSRMTWSVIGLLRGTDLQSVP